MSFSWGSTFSGWGSGRSANRAQSIVDSQIIGRPDIWHLESHQHCAKISRSLAYA